MSGGEAESREAAARIATAEANAAKELRARQAMEAKLEKMEHENRELKDALDEANRNLADTQVRKTKRNLRYSVKLLFNTDGFYIAAVDGIRANIILLHRRIVYVRSNVWPVRPRSSCRSYKYSSHRNECGPPRYSHKYRYTSSSVLLDL